MAADSELNSEKNLPVARLFVQLPEEAEIKIVELFSGQVFRIGRAKTNDLVVDQQEISRNHALLSASASGIVLSDLSSLNGTFLNARKLSYPIDVETGDEITIDTIKIKVEILRDRALGKKENLSDIEIDRTHASKITTSIVSVLVVDICGYTRLSQELPSMEVVEILDLWFKKASAIINSQQGEVDKYIGDCILALWRSDTEQASEQARRAVLAAKEILAETHKLAEASWKYQNKTAWKCRCAINTGEALIGAIGGVSREYTVLGDTVNVAFKMERIASNKSLDLLISSATASYLKDIFNLVSIDKHQIEGRSDAVELFILK